MEFKVISSDTENADVLSANPRERISKLIEENPVFLFMKGTPEAPQCGFSNRVIQVLNTWDVPFESIDVLSDEIIRQEIKDFSNWPTISQLYINREFIGGCDIVEELSSNGELADVLKQAYPERKFNTPKPTAEVQEISPTEASEMLKQNPSIKFLDVRTTEERDIACIENSLMLDDQLAQEILDSWNKESPMMLICHNGVRSLQAGQYFTSQGFQQVYHVSDGIDGWSVNFDPSVTRY